ncbi:MAG: putative Ig domain-containing protein [Sediminibacterium sp.]
MKKAMIYCWVMLFIIACKHEIPSTAVVPTNLVYSPSISSIIKGSSGNSIKPSIDDGGGTISYNISSGIIDGISIDNSSGVISWSSAVALGNYSISVTATNEAGSTATTYQLIVNNALTAPLNLAYTPSSSTMVLGTSGNSSIPSINNGGATCGFSITGTIPAGISINSSTGVISWTNTVAVGVYNLNIEAINSVGKTNTAYILTITSAATVVAPNSFLYNPANSSMIQGTVGNSATPTINAGLGSIVYSFSVIPTTGISINTTTGIISWNANLAIGLYTISVKATNSAGSTNATYTLNITTATSNGQVCFSSEVLPLFQSYCGQSGCHNSISKKSGVITDTYANIMKGISANKPNSSKYFKVITDGSMPPNGSAKLSTVQIDIIKKWINEGAKNSTCASTVCDSTQITYNNGLSQLFATNCNGCHGVAPGAGNVVLSDYASAKAAGINMKTNFLSAINFTATTASKNMPPSGKMTNCQILQITKWINNGCPQ